MFTWRPARRKRRHTALLGALALLFIILLTSQHHTRIGRLARYHQSTTFERTFDPLTSQHARLWKALFGRILNNNPRCDKKPDLVVPRNPLISYDPDRDRPRPDVLWIDDSDLSRLKSAHANFVKDIRVLSDSLVYNAGSKGIVTTASESLLAVLSISLCMLRKTESTLPVEIFLSRPTPYTNEFCVKVFPQLNATCRYLSDIFNESDTTVELVSYQYKVFSVLFSSFEDVLLLDADAWPVTKPEPLFHSLPFTDSGLVLWPDFWYASESPYFFDIAKITDPPPLRTRAATESGEMLYSKSKHVLSIMLATYYNYYGPDYYYLLQSQGGLGQGDKETFPMAALALDEDFYSVKHPVHSIGRHDSNGEYLGSAMVQFDPVQDFFYNAQPAARVPFKSPAEVAHPPKAIPLINTNKKRTPSPPKPLFVHANFPKLDPYTIFNDEPSRGIRTPTRDTNGKLVRCWMPEADAIEMFGFDVEKRFWEAMEEQACGALLGLQLAGSKPDKPSLEMVRRRDKEVCARVRAYFKAVFKTEAE